MSSIDEPCKLCLSCRQLEPKISSIDQILFSKIGNLLLSLSSKTPSIIKEEGLSVGLTQFVGGRGQRNKLSLAPSVGVLRKSLHKFGIYRNRVK